MNKFLILLCFCFLYGSKSVHGSIGSSLGLKSPTGTSPMEKFAPGNIYDSSKDALKGIAKQIPESIPTPQTILSFGKNMLAGVPVQLAFQLINQACSAAITQKEVKPKILPDVTKMNFQLKTCGGDYFIPILTPELLATHPAFDASLNTVILVTGWFSNVDSTMENDALETVWKAYKCRGDTNFIALDAAAYVDTLYTWSALNTDEIGKIAARGLVEFLKVYPKEKLHLVGHSLGGHIVGAMGRYYNLLTSTLLPRITALDPASPCFNEGENLNTVSRGDAEFVDVIHSNSGILGKREPVGDADFYPNGVNPLPPGCVSITCAHARSWEFFAESVYPGNHNAFLATRCNSITSLNSGKCAGKRISMGIVCPVGAKGNYFLNTKSRRSFGEHTLNESEIECAKCTHTTAK